MTSWGMRTRETADGNGALQILHQAFEEGDAFRVAVIDRQMPGMDGEALGHAIRGDRRLAGLRMVMLSSLGTLDHPRRFEETGFDACLTKPIRHLELKAVLSQV